VDNIKRNDLIFIPYPRKTLECHRDCSPMIQRHALPVPSREGEAAPGWWFHRYEPIWRPFIERICREKKVTLREFERAASQVPGLTHIEKAIAMSAFRQQQEQPLQPSHNTAAFRGEPGLSVV
jgi:hypothetical protein